MADEITFDEEQNLGSRGGALAYAEYVVTRLALGGVGRLPQFAQDAIVAGIARLAMRFDKRHTNAARAFIAQALGAAAAREDWRILAAYRHLFQMSIDAEAFDRKVPQARLLEHYTIVGSEEELAELRAAHGGILVTPHVGDWEAGSALMPHIGMGPAHVVARPPKNRYLSRHLLRVREKRRVTVMPRRGGMKQTAAILERGGWIAMLLDQRPSGKHAIAPFFGRLARCERSAAVLMKRLGVPIYFGACYKTARPFHYEIRFSRRLSPAELGELSLDEVVALVNAEQERLILHAPEQYFWLHDRYRDSPSTSVAEGEHSASHAIPGR